MDPLVDDPSDGARPDRACCPGAVFRDRPEEAVKHGLGPGSDKPRIWPLCQFRLWCQLKRDEHLGVVRQLFGRAEPPPQRVSRFAENLAHAVVAIDLAELASR